MRVTDDGSGFDPSRCDRLFRLFSRLHSNRDYPGYGIGLALVRRVVSLHGGDVAISGAPGEGACVCVRLPAHLAMPEALGD